MNQNTKLDPLLTSKILWIALTMSILIYGVMLYLVKKDVVFTFPDTYSPLELVALMANLILFVTFGIHEKVVKKTTDLQKKTSLYIVCWALNEVIAILAFVAVFTASPGHMLIFAVNVMTALFGNLIMFPRKSDQPPR